MAFRITGPRIKVMLALLAAPQGKHWGYDLMRKTGLTSGTLYPILDALSERGWISAHTEDVSAEELRRPRRRYYVVTGHGVRAMHKQLEMIMPARSPATLQARV